MRFFRDNIGPVSNFLPGRPRLRRKGPADVVLVQGFGTSATSMAPVARALKARGLRVVPAPLGGLLGYLQTRGVGSAGDRLARFVNGLPGDERIWIVGHSIGGILARHAVQRADAHGRVAGIVTLGSPHKGTPAALAGLALGLGFVSPSPFQMLPFAPTIRRLNRLPWPHDVRLVSIVSTSDPLCVHPFGLVPFADGRLVRCIEFEGLGHTAMLRDARVQDAVAGEILNGK